MLDCNISIKVILQSSNKMSISQLRFKLQDQLFKKFTKNSERFQPKLFVPPITHYKFKHSIPSETEIDFERNTYHLKYMLDSVDGFLINGSTGDGWELTNNDQISIINNALKSINKANNKFKPILIGALRYTTKDVDQYIQQLITEYAKIDLLNANNDQSPFIGFVVCPPSNIDDQNIIFQELDGLFTKYKEYPFIIYQLPQITKNEIESNTLDELINKHSNIIMFKDSSTIDNICKSGKSLNGVIAVKGSEGYYLDNLLTTKYGVSSFHGLLLSTANNYPKILQSMLIKSVVDLKIKENYDIETAFSISNKITFLSNETFNYVSKYKFNNPFSNSARIVDFFMAHGRNACKDAISAKKFPITKDGEIFKGSDLMDIFNILNAHDVIPFNGYLQKFGKNTH